MKTEVAICWLRTDLRLHDHPVLQQAARHERLLPVYCLDPREWTDNAPLGLPRAGQRRLHWLRQGLEVLCGKLRTLGSDLLLLEGLPEERLPALAKTIGATHLYTCDAPASDEQICLRRLGQKLSPLGVSLLALQEEGLLHPDDLPFPIERLPQVFTAFRHKVEAGGLQVRPALPAPLSLPPLPDGIPPCDTLPWPDAPVADPRTAFPFPGGEDAAMARLQDYLWDRGLLSTYKETRNGLVGEAYSSKLSPFLAQGSLSARQVYWEVKAYEQQREANDSTYWLIFELLWRDYFRLVVRQAGSKLFRLGGLSGIRPKVHAKAEADFARWCQGQTGQPFIDACMRELLHTGFLSNRGRQNAASYLCKQLHVDWRWGAYWFEQQLLDYDPCSNWGNWAYIAGVGNDPRDNRVFNPYKQAQQYDPQGDFVRLWH